MPVIRRPAADRQRLVNLIESAGKSEGRAGWFEGSKYERGAPVAGVATVQEYGSPARGIPPRPFMRPTIAERQADWAATSHKGSLAVLSGSMTGAVVVELVAARAAGDVRRTISKIQDPPLAPATVAARLRKYSGKRKAPSKTASKPLVDSGLLLASLTHMVVKK